VGPEEKAPPRSVTRGEPALAVSVVLVGLLGCGSGTVLNQPVNVDTLSDAAVPAWLGGDGHSFQDPFSGAPAYVAQMADDPHNPGTSCMQSGCHGSVAAASSFLIGGTIYADYAGRVPAPGVEVRIVDAAGRATSTYTGVKGNFYIMTANAKGVTLPAIIGARDANSARPMITALSAGLGSCAQTQCHVSGVGPINDSGNYYPIHVP
jgi:hypothetical protein